MFAQAYQGIIFSGIATEGTILMREAAHLFQVVHQGVECTLTQFSSLPAQYQNERQPVNSLLLCVVKDEDIDKTKKETAQHDSAYYIKI